MERVALEVAWDNTPAKELPVPRYFFDLFEDEQSTRDQVGSDFPDLEAATADAARALVEYARDMVTHAGNIVPVAFHIRNEAGVTVINVKLELSARLAPGIGTAAPGPLQH